MPWRECTWMSERQEFVRLAAQAGSNLSELSRRYGVSRKTAYKWLARAGAGDGLLKDRSRRPVSSPARVSPTMEALICGLRRAYPWGGRKIRHRLLADGHGDVPAASSISAILRRNGLMEPSPRPQRDYLRFEEALPNALWQMDFKGHFAVGRGRCHPLTLLDDHSRFNLCLQACADERETTVKSRLTAVFHRYGLPQRILADNGPPWGSAGQGSYTALSVWLMQLGVLLVHGRPHHPQTQGKEERFHRTLKLEVLARQASWHSLAEVQDALDCWRDVYNLYRPHEALGHLPPSARYRPSTRALPERLPPIEYPASDVVRIVSGKGSISFNGHRFFIGNAFEGEPVALRAVDECVWEVYYCHQHITSLDLAASSPGNV